MGCSQGWSLGGNALSWGGGTLEPQLRKPEAGKDGMLETCLCGHSFLLLKPVRYVLAACLKGLI